MIDRIGDEVRRSLAATGSPAAGSLPAIVDAWPGVVGEAIARAAWPQRIARDGTLHVATTSSTWAFELGRMSPEIAERLRAALGEDAPASLRFAPGRVPPPVTAEAPEPRVETTAEAREAAAEIASVIDDEELRELVARAAAASLSQARSDHHF